MDDLCSKQDIEKISYEILKGSNSLGLFPTPIKDIVQYSDLTIRNNVDLLSIHPTYQAQATDVLYKALGKIRGVFDWRKKTIYVDASIKNSAKKNFVTLHEVGHGVLPWQSLSHSATEDDDQSLSPEAREEFEAEANFFAAATLFQQDVFSTELNKHGLGIESVILLSKQFGASLQATFRRYVECSKNRCALLVLENPSTLDGQHKCFLRNQFQSDNFSKDFGFIKIPQELGYDWTFVNDYCRNRRYIKDGAITLLTSNGSVDFHYHFFNNTYNAFVFFFPKGEKKSTRTQIILTGIDL